MDTDTLKLIEDCYMAGFKPIGKLYRCPGCFNLLVECFDDGEATELPVVGGEFFYEVCPTCNYTYYPNPDSSYLSPCYTHADEDTDYTTEPWIEEPWASYLPSSGFEQAS